MEGHVSLKEAADRIGRSTARTRQYFHAGKITGMRDEMGNLQVSLESLAQFTPPERGNARARGISPNTKLRHAKATCKLVEEMIADGPAKTATMQVLHALVGALATKAAEATESDDSDDNDDDEDEDAIEVVAAKPVAVAEPADSMENLLNRI